MLFQCCLFGRETCLSCMSESHSVCLFINHVLYITAVDLFRIDIE